MPTFVNRIIVPGGNKGSNVLTNKILEFNPSTVLQSTPYVNMSATLPVAAEYVRSIPLP
jgi:hypothetical protein